VHSVCKASVSYVCVYFNTPISQVLLWILQNFRDDGKEEDKGVVV